MNLLTFFIKFFRLYFFLTSYFCLFFSLILFLFFTLQLLYVNRDEYRCQLTHSFQYSYKLQLFRKSAQYKKYKIMNTYKRIVKKNKQIAPIINMLRAHILHGFLQLA